MMDWIPEADGVFRGGGVKGLGIAGALIGFAEHPKKPIERWVNVAGASAGAIIAAYVACGHTAQELTDLLADTDFRKFQDFGRLGPIAGGVTNVMGRHGVVRGRAIEAWLDDVFGDKTFAAVPTADGKGARLKVLTVDITNRAMLVLPDDLLDADGKALWIDPKTRDEVRPESLTIARAVRMSMAMPYFFPPVQMIWKETGAKATLVDGGTLSNFPVWLFDTERTAPVRATIGITLTGGHGFGGGVEKAMKRAPWAVGQGWDILQTAMQAWDKRFVGHTTRVRTCAVDAGQVGTTDYGISDEQKHELVVSGERAARDFLDGFDLENYINSFGQKLVAPTG
jgi:NTE family protein